MKKESGHGAEPLVGMAELVCDPVLVGVAMSVHQVQIGDTIVWAGHEWVVWSVACEVWADAETANVKCVDPLKALHWRQKNAADVAQTELLTNGTLQTMINQAID